MVHTYLAADKAIGVVHDQVVDVRLVREDHKRHGVAVGRQIIVGRDSIAEIGNILRGVSLPRLRSVAITNDQISKVTLTAKFSRDVPASPSVFQRRGVVHVMPTFRQNRQASGVHIK